MIIIHFIYFFVIVGPAHFRCATLLSFFFFWYFNATIRKFKTGHVALLASAGPTVCWSMVRNEAHTLAAVTSGISQTILQTKLSTTQEGLSVLLYIEGLNHRRGFTQQVAL